MTFWLPRGALDAVIVGTEESSELPKICTSPWKAKELRSSCMLPVTSVIDPDPDPNIIKKTKKLENPWFLPFCDFFDFFSLKTDANVRYRVPSKSAIIGKKQFFGWHLESHWWKEQDPDPNPGGKMSRIHNTAYQKSSFSVNCFFSWLMVPAWWALGNFSQDRYPYG